VRRRQATHLAALAAGATALLTLGATATGAAASSSGTTNDSTSRPLPYRVFAPYYEMYDSSTNLATLS
jgi:hypothetical protein